MWVGEKVKRVGGAEERRALSLTLFFPSHHASGFFGCASVSVVSEL
jgi:hypothetical protein